MAGNNGAREAFSPASGEVVGVFSVLDEAQAAEAAAVAARAFGQWSATTFAERGRFLDRVRGLMSGGGRRHLPS